MTPAEFIEKWGPGGPAYHLNEEQGAQSYFLDLCELLDVPKPGSQGDYLFEKSNLVLGEARGYADVFLRDHFAWENKAPNKNLDTALKQLLIYSLALGNPPLLVVCDRLTTRIHTQFNGHPSVTYTILLGELAQPEKRELLRRVWTKPESFRPKQTTRDITEAAARSFATLAEQLRKRGNGADKVAHFLTQCLFCFFAEDVSLLPGRMFERMVSNRGMPGSRLTAGLSNLFIAMRDGGLYGADDIPWFNGGLFKIVDVPMLETMDIAELRNAAALNWSAIDVSIFGTLFERGLDPGKRSQLGAHYTDPATIERLIDPVVRRPLLKEWQQAAKEIRAFSVKIVKKGDRHYRAAHTRFITWLERLRAYRVLDPACGSGNFLFLSLKALKDIEHQSHIDAAAIGLDREQDLVTGPQNMLGIELNEYAAELARVTVWIGELQWRIEHGYAFKTNPVLEPLDHIECRDALLDCTSQSESDAPTQVQEAQWPSADVVVGNPPFLGGSKKSGELGRDHFNALNLIYDQDVPGGADLVCYWFHKAKKQIQAGQLKAAGLVATQAIRAGSNRKVLDAIVKATRIFEAWSDEPWVNDGAAVRVSLVGFGAYEGARLDGATVTEIHADLTAGEGLDLTQAKLLMENADTSFEGTKKYGKFDIPGSIARSWLRSPNPNGKSNSIVVKPWANGKGITNRPSDKWIIDFEVLSKTDAALYELPFQYVQVHVQPVRAEDSNAKNRDQWWLYERPRLEMRKALKPLSRFIVTPRVAKHRFFVWQPATLLPDTRLCVISREDDVTFGLLSSRIHEVWALATASMHGVGNDPTYNGKSCFETFPFPSGLSPQDTKHGVADTPQANVIAEAARHLDELRNNWLNPPEWTRRVPEVVPLGMDRSPYPDRIESKAGFEKELAKRTLTNLYNQRPAWLDNVHRQLDAAVASAYGWTDYTPEMADEEILRRLLVLNLAR